MAQPPIRPVETRPDDDPVVVLRDLIRVVNDNLIPRLQAAEATIDELKAQV